VVIRERVLPLSERRRKLKQRRRNLMREIRVMWAMSEMRRSKIPHHLEILPMFHHHLHSPNPNLPHTLTWVGRLSHPKCL